MNQKYVYERARRTSREPSLLNKPLGERKRDRELGRRLGTGQGKKE